LKPPIIRNLSELHALWSSWRMDGETIGVVPTMGALHDGHLSLVRAAKARCARVIVTIFVNPKQFNSPLDYENYPRTEEEDAQKLSKYGVDAIGVPTGSIMYPPAFSTTVSIKGLTDVLCGAHRPGHFDGVATVVTKLFGQTGATHAFFGEKDFQQLQVVRRLSEDLNLWVDVIGCPTIREEDGLAMSSRNLLISDRARVKAPTLHQALTRIATGLAAGTPFAELKSKAVAEITRAGFTEVEYLDLRANDDLRPLERANVPSRLLVAAWLAGVRLIDNIDATAP
jgi:pantoate--beta-alanine ligase